MVKWAEEITNLYKKFNPVSVDKPAQGWFIALMHVVIVTSRELARESLMGVRPCQVKVQSACWHRCCQVCPSLRSVRCPTCCVSVCWSIRRTLQNCRIWTCGSFFSFPRDPELRKTRSKLKVAVAIRRDEEKHQFTKEDRGDANLTADDQTAPRVVRLRAMYLTQHCMLQKPIKIVGEFSCSAGKCGTVETWKLQLCNHGKHGV